MLETTKKNLKRPMAVVFVEQKRDLVERDGVMVEVERPYLTGFFSGQTFTMIETTVMRIEPGAGN